MIKNKSLKGEMEMLNRQESSLEYFETHLSSIKTLLSQYKIDSFERSMSNFAKELTALKYMVAETLAAGSNYLFAKYDSVVNEVVQEESAELNSSPLDNNNNNTTNIISTGSSAYNRILAEMVGLSAAQTVEQIDARRKEISQELAEKTKISTITDFEVSIKICLLNFFIPLTFLFVFRNSAMQFKNSTNTFIQILPLLLK